MTYPIFLLKLLISLTVSIPDCTQVLVKAKWAALLATGVESTLNINVQLDLMTTNAVSSSWITRRSNKRRWDKMTAKVLWRCRGWWVP